MIRSVSVDSPYYWQIGTECREQIHAWVDTFSDHRRTKSVTLEDEGTVLAIELVPEYQEGPRYQIVRYRPATPPPWVLWDTA